MSEVYLYCWRQALVESGLELAGGNYLHVTYHDLNSDPQVCAWICDYLGLPASPDMERYWAAHQKPQSEGKGSQHPDMRYTSKSRVAAWRRHLSR